MILFSKCAENNLDVSNSVSESKECLNTIMSQSKEGANSMINKYKEGLNTSISEDCLMGVTSRSKEVNNMYAGAVDRYIYNQKSISEKDENSMNNNDLTTRDSNEGQVLINAMDMMNEVIDYVLFVFVYKKDEEGIPTDYIEIYKIDDEYNVRATVEYKDEYADHANFLELKTEKFYAGGVDNNRSTKNFLEITRLLREFFFNGDVNARLLSDKFELFLNINGNKVSTNKFYSIEQLVEFIMNNTDIYFEEML